MKEICRVDSGPLHEGFQPFKVVVEVSRQKNMEVEVKVDRYPESHVEIFSGGISLCPKTLKVNASRVSASELLLNVELCKFVMDTYPGLKEIKFK